jgi:hypothetical protein
MATRQKNVAMVVHPEIAAHATYTLAPAASLPITQVSGPGPSPTHRAKIVESGNVDAHVPHSPIRRMDLKDQHEYEYMNATTGHA